MKYDCLDEERKKAHLYLDAYYKYLETNNIRSQAEISCRKSYRDICCAASQLLGLLEQEISSDFQSLAQKAKAILGIKEE